MNFKNYFLILLILAAAGSEAAAQGEIPINMYGGSPGINIPLYTITDHDLSEQISLAYNVSDVNLNGGHTYGVGWDLSSNNQMVSREVRGLPDDFGTGSETRKGWLYNTNYYSILSFPNSSDLSVSTCTDEQSDNTYLNNLGYLVDTEPDLFSFSVGGMSGHFVFNNTNGTPTISLIPWQDIQIVPTFQSSPSNMTITGWTITTNSGVVYTFNDNTSVTRILKKNTTPTDQTMLSFFEREYQLYKTQVSYSPSWMLTNVVSPTGARINYVYSTNSGSTATSRNAQIFDASYNGSWYPWFGLMTDSVFANSKKISSISTTYGMWATCDPYDGIRIYDPTRWPAQFKHFSLSYQGAFLSGVAESGSGVSLVMPGYRLYYLNTAAYPSSASTNQDFWGFYNGASNKPGTIQSSFPTIYAYPAETGADRYRIYPSSSSGTAVVLPGTAVRLPDPNAMLTGTLQRLVYPTGGETDLSFEANTYYDAKASKDQLAGGLRIKFVTYYDGVNPAANISKSFSYTDASGHSSGSLISRPSFAIPVWQYTTPAKSDGSAGTTIAYNSGTPASTLWRQITAVTGDAIGASDLTGGSIVGYSRVTVARAGSGSVTFDYLVPATYGSSATGSDSTAWVPTTMKFARPSACPSMNIIGGGETWGYPAFPNPYYDYERGLLQKKTEYNNSGTRVRVTQNTYQYIFKSYSPSNVVGLAYERFANSTAAIFIYGRYTLLTDLAKAVASQTVTTYDENDTSRHATVITQYNYSRGNHRLLSKINTTTPDGVVYGTSFKYTLDYPVTTQPSDSTLWMIYLLKNSYRNGQVIEQIMSVKPSAGTEMTTGATLFKYRPFTFNKPLLSSQLVFRPGAPVTDFVASGVTSNVFTNDSRYETVRTINEYTAYDIPLSSTGENRITTGQLWGFNTRVPIAKISQARTNNVSFSDFETTTGSEFTVANGYFGTGRTGAYAIHPYATLTRTMTKPAGATNYLLSFWLKDVHARTITLQVVVKDGNGTVKSTNNYPYSYSTDGLYQFFTQAVSVSSVTTSTFTIQVQGQSLSQPSGTASSLGAGTYYTLQPTLLPMLDDIGFYPDYAAISSVTYDLPFGANSSTTPGGNTSYTSYDAVGRPYMVTDQDANVRQRYTYNLWGQTSLQTLGATTCATGVQTVVNGVVTASYSCAGVSADPSYTTFHVNSFANLSGSTVMTYQWRFRALGTTGWSLDGTNSDTYTTFVNSSTGVSFEVSCLITVSDGRTVETLPIAVTIIGGS